MIRRPDAAAITEAVRRLRNGELVAFPTETVYGLGGNALYASAVQRIFTTKGRPNTNPLIVHVADVAAARSLVRDWPPTADVLAARWWPGPLALILPKAPHIPDAVTAGGDTVAIRIPRHPVALALLEAVGLLLAAPSANRSMAVSPTTAAHVAESFGDELLVLDGGATEVGIESTVLDLSVRPARVLRHGMLGVEALSELIGRIDEGAGTADEREAMPAPGMMARHYAPRAAVSLVATEEVAPTIARLRAAGERVGAIVWNASATQATHQTVLPATPDGYAHGLYAALHDADSARCDAFVIERVPDDPAWTAIHDRLTRAAHPA